MHGFVEDDKAGAPAGVGLQHGRRGITQQMLSAFISGMTARNADTGSQEDFALFRNKGRRKLLLNSIGDAGGITYRFKIIDQQREGISFHSGDRIGGPNPPEDPLTDLDQQAIGWRRTQTAVHHFEAVQVYVQKREHMTGLTAAL